MAEKRPLVYKDGSISELPNGDSLGGDYVFGDVTAGSGLVGGGNLSDSNKRLDVALAPQPSGLIFADEKLGLDGTLETVATEANSAAIQASSLATVALASGLAAENLTEQALDTSNEALEKAANPGGSVTAKLTAVGSVDVGRGVGINDSGLLEQVSTNPVYTSIPIATELTEPFGLVYNGDKDPFRFIPITIDNQDPEKPVSIGRSLWFLDSTQYLVNLASFNTAEGFPRTPIYVWSSAITYAFDVVNLEDGGICWVYFSNSASNISTGTYTGSNLNLTQIDSVAIVGANTQFTPTHTKLVVQQDVKVVHCLIDNLFGSEGNDIWFNTYSYSNPAMDRWYISEFVYQNQGFTRLLSGGNKYIIGFDAISTPYANGTSNLYSNVTVVYGISGQNWQISTFDFSINQGLNNQTDRVISSGITVSNLIKPININIPWLSSQTGDKVAVAVWGERTGGTAEISYAVVYGMSSVGFRFYGTSTNIYDTPTGNSSLFRNYYAVADEASQSVIVWANETGLNTARMAMSFTITPGTWAITPSAVNPQPNADSDFYNSSLLRDETLGENYEFCVTNQQTTQTTYTIQIQKVQPIVNFNYSPNVSGVYSYMGASNQNASDGDLVLFTMPDSTTYYTLGTQTPTNYYTPGRNYYLDTASGTYTLASGTPALWPDARAWKPAAKAISTSGLLLINTL